MDRTLISESCYCTLFHLYFITLRNHQPHNFSALPLTCPWFFCCVPSISFLSILSPTQTYTIDNCSLFPFTCRAIGSSVRSSNTSLLQPCRAALLATVTKVLLWCCSQLGWRTLLIATTALSRELPLPAYAMMHLLMRQRADFQQAHQEPSAELGPVEQTTTCTRYKR